MRVLFPMGLLAVGQTAVANDMSFKAAKGSADCEESKLSAANSDALVASQTAVLDEVLSTCPVSLDAVPPPFIVVLELDAHGSIIRT
jgi:hypothetical protein